MKAILSIFAVLWAVVSGTFLGSCTNRKTMVEMDFDSGIRALAGDLATQLEKLGPGNGVDQVESNAQSKRTTVRRVVVEPFMDVESGEPVKLNALISSIMTVEMAKRFPVSWNMDQNDLEVSEYVVTGLVSLEEKARGTKSYMINAAIYEKSSGVVHASAEARITGIDKYRTRREQTSRDNGGLRP